MSDSVTTYGSGTLGEIPGNVRVYTAAETDSVVSSAVSELSGSVAGSIAALSGEVSGIVQSGVTHDELHDLIKDDYSSSAYSGVVEIGSGKSGLIELSFNHNQGKTHVVLERDIQSTCGISGLNTDIYSLHGLLSQARDLYPTIGISDHDLAKEVARRAFCGDALYEVIESDSPYSGTDSGLERAALATYACWELFGVSGVNVGTLKQFLQDVESSGSVCNLISGCMSGTVSGIMEDISGLQNCCSSVGDLNAAMTSLNSAVASLQSATCGISATLSGMADAISGLPDAIVEAIDSAPLLTEEVKAKAKAAVLPAVHDMNQTLNQKKNDLAEDLAAMADALDDNDPTAIDSVSEALSEVADAAESASMSDAAESASSGADEASSASSSAANESTVIEALPGFVP
jgi:uncharacterized protein YoxC